MINISTPYCDNAIRSWITDLPRPESLGDLLQVIDWKVTFQTCHDQLQRREAISRLLATGGPLNSYMLKVVITATQPRH